MKILTTIYILGFIFIFVYLKKRYIIEPISAGAEAQLSTSSHPNNLFIGTGEPIAFNADTSLESTSLEATTSPKSTSQPQLVRQEFTRQGVYNNKDMEIAHLQYLLEQEKAKKSFIKQIVEFVWNF